MHRKLNSQNTTPKNFVKKNIEENIQKKNVQELIPFKKHDSVLMPGDSSKNVVTNQTTKPTVESTPVWSNKEVKVRKEFTVIVPTSIENTMLALNDEYNDVEFTILTKTEWCEEINSFIMSEEYFLPKQQVSSAHIDYEEDNTAFNTVIHKHPNGCKGFSGTDEEYINANFDFSLLWVDKTFHIGHVRIKVDGYGDTFYFKIPLVIKKQSVKEFLPENCKEKIIRKSSQTWQYRQAGNGTKIYGGTSVGGAYGSYMGGYSGSVGGKTHEEKKDYTGWWQQHLEDQEKDTWYGSKGDDTYDFLLDDKDRKSGGSHFCPGSFSQDLADQDLDEAFLRAMEKDSQSEDLRDYIQQGMEKQEIQRLASACGVEISDEELEEVSFGDLDDLKSASVLDAVSQRFIENQQKVNI